MDESTLQWYQSHAKLKRSYIINSIRTNTSRKTGALALCAGGDRTRLASSIVVGTVTVCCASQLPRQERLYQRRYRCIKVVRCEN